MASDGAQALLNDLADMSDSFIPTLSIRRLASRRLNIQIYGDALSFILCRSAKRGDRIITTAKFIVIDNG